jgi:hypothetical protein
MKPVALIGVHTACGDRRPPKAEVCASPRPFHVPLWFDSQSKYERQRFLPFVESEKLLSVKLFGQRDM